LQRLRCAQPEQERSEQAAQEEGEVALERREVNVEREPLGSPLVA